MLKKDKKAKDKITILSQFKRRERENGSGRVQRNFLEECEGNAKEM